MDRKSSMQIVFYIVLLASTGFALFIHRHPASASAVVNTPTPTRTVTPTLIPKASATVDPLKLLRKQLIFGFGGGGLGIDGLNDNCAELLKSFRGILPAVVDSGRAPGSVNLASVCVFGYPLDRPLRLSLTAPDGSQFGPGIFRRGEAIVAGEGSKLYFVEQMNPTLSDRNVGLLDLGGNTPVIEIVLWRPPDLMSGDWRIAASSVLKAANGKFQGSWPKNSPVIYVPNHGRINPLERPGLFYGPDAVGFYSLKSGDRLPLVGIGLAANRVYPLALYNMITSNLYQAFPQQTNARGTFAIDLLIESNDPAGSYHLILVNQPKDSDPYPPGLYLGLNIPEWNPCPGAPVSHLSTGMYVQLNPKYPTPNRVRSQPGLKGTPVGTIKNGDDLQIIEGPKCVDQMVWWKVTIYDVPYGWTSEGKGSEQYLIKQFTY